MEILLPAENCSGSTWQQRIQTLAQTPVLSPFDPVLLDFVQTVSSSFMSLPHSHSYPEIVATAFWMRKAHIQQIKRDYFHLYPNAISLPRGIILHIAPAHVDSIFIYSWFLSLLTGNNNIIRLSPHRNSQTDLLLSTLNSIIQKPAFAAIQQRNAVVSYEHQDEITKLLSSYCQVRVIWGGDSTVQHIRSIPLPPDALDIPFADKFSMCVLHAQHVNTASIDNLKLLVERFYNDAFWFHQNACSSPRLIVWVGHDSDIASAKQRFWLGLSDVLTKKRVQWEPALRINRLAAGYQLAAQGIADQLSSVTADLPYRVHIKKLTPTLRQQHCGSGMFFETETESLLDLASFISPQDQTLSVYGFTKQELEYFVNFLPARGLHRIVPVGTALDFQPIWDGVNLLSAFTRKCTIEPNLTFQ